MEQRPTWQRTLPAGSRLPTCPRCGSREGFRPVTVQKSGDDLGLPVLLFGGFLFYLLYSSNRQPQSQILCEHCGLVFPAAKPNSDWSPMLVMLILGGLLAFIWMVWSIQASL